jgi:predicted nucleotidyltransferase
MRFPPKELKTIDIIDKLRRIYSRVPQRGSGGTALCKLVHNSFMDTATIEARLRELLTARAEREGIAAAYLFGSVARGTQGPGSDVDVGVLYSEDPPATLDGLGLGLEGDLEDLLGVPVQVVVLNGAPVDLIVRVLRDGKLLVNRDPSKRIRFEVKSRNEFWDLEPYLKMYRRMTG